MRKAVTQLSIAATDKQMRELLRAAERNGLVQRTCSTCGRLMQLWARDPDKQVRCEDCGGPYLLEVADA